MKDETTKVNLTQDDTVYKPLSHEISGPQLLKNGKTNKQRDSLFLYFSSMAADLIMFDCGCNFTWTSPAMSTLHSTDLSINPLGEPITAFQESWIAAVVHLGAAVGPLAFGKLADILGRKKVLILIAILKIISYFILAYAQNLIFFYLGRFIIGIAMGLSFTIMPMYTAEISENHNRGKLVSIMGIFITLGTLYSLIIGPLLPLKEFTLSSLVFLIIEIIGLVSFIPESPIFLLSVGKRLEAKKVMMKLRNTNSDFAEKILIELTETLEESQSRKTKFADIFKSYQLRKALFICMGLCSLQHLSGIFPIMAFIGPIFEATRSSIPANLSVILVSVIQLISTFLAIFLIEKLGRKVLLLISATGCSITLLSLGIYFYLEESRSQYLQSIFWLPVTSLMMYMITYSVGLTTVPMTILSEVFPSNVRSASTSFVTFFGAFTGFTLTFLFPVVTAFLGGSKCFWLFSGFTALGAILIYFVVPETKGKSLSEIQNILSKK